MHTYRQTYALVCIYVLKPYRLRAPLKTAGEVAEPQRNEEAGSELLQVTHFDLVLQVTCSIAPIIFATLITLTVIIFVAIVVMMIIFDYTITNC